MRLLVVLLLIAVSSAKLVRQLAPLFKHENKIDGEYIVVLKHDSNLDDFKKAIGVRESEAVGIHIQKEYRGVFKGFEARMNRLGLLQVRRRQDVAYVEEDMVVEKYDTAATWGLDRVDQRYLPLDTQANFPGTGYGVTAYIIDTGIYPENQYFEGRAQIAVDALRGDGVDCNGHGTHCAGTIGSNPYGIARDVELRGVRVLSCFGYGSTSDIVAGMDWVALNHVGPSVASLSLGGYGNYALDEGVRGLIRHGVVTSVAAGNSDDNACYYSPAREPMAITVGSTAMKGGLTDERSYFSNYGNCVDIFAPGSDIKSTWIGATDAVNTISGTSMACPHVSGALCVLLGNNPEMTPKDLERELIQMATDNVIKDVGYASPNRLLYIGVDYAKEKNTTDEWDDVKPKQGLIPV